MADAGNRANTLLQTAALRTAPTPVSLATFAAALSIACAQALADDKKPSLSQQLANPIANLVSVPIQYNKLYGAGKDGNGTVSVLDIQPVIPFSLNSEWNLITRTIVPIETTNNIAHGAGDASGLGDTQLSLFLSPEKTGPSGIIWGLGAVVNAPTASNSLLGTQEWGAGPSAVALIQNETWTVGALGNQMWSLNGNDINKSFMQPWITYELKQGWSVSATSQTSYNWNTRNWTVPLNVGVAKLFNIGNQPVQLQVGGIYMLTAPADAPRWGIQTTLTFLFPES